MFSLIKFRTMVPGAEGDGVAQWAGPQDPRVTRVGRVLRRTRLDELPNVWNVLRGEMSLVGPRPERPEFVSLLQHRIPFYRTRLIVRPGLTGWAQVNRPYVPVDEIIVVDGGSTDGTVELVSRYVRQHPGLPLRLVFCSEASIPKAVNTGIRATTGEVIVRLDAHVCPARNYVRACLDALERTSAGVVGGVWDIVAGRDSATARAIALAVVHPLGAGDAAYRVATHALGERDVDTVPFGCFPRALWQALGGFEERLLTNEDYDFNYRVRLTGHRVVLDPRIRCAYAARGTLRALASQYFRYGWWKAQMLKRHPRSVRWRQVVPALLLPVIVLLAVGSVFLPLAQYMLIALLAAYGTGIAAVSIQLAARNSAWQLLPALLAVFPTLHLSWSAGFASNCLTGGYWPSWSSNLGGQPSVARTADGLEE